MKKLAKFFPLILAYLSIDMEAKLKKKEKLELTDEDKEKLDAEAKIQGFAEKFMKDYNRELEADEDNSATLELVANYMKDFEAEDQVSEGSEDDSDEEPTTTVSAGVKKLYATMDSRIKKLEADNKKLASQPEGDETVEKIKGKAMPNKIAHSKTHLFASAEPWNAFESRPWNAAVRDGQIEAATDWNDAVNIQKLNTDLGAYARKNASEIFSMLMDGLSLPAHWQVVSGVTDEHVFVNIVTGDITQGYKAQWLPANKQEFAPVKNKIFDIQIDATWTVTQLKQIERSYLQQFFQATSSPYKEDFVTYLAKELIKKARKEDKIALFKGVHYQTPASATKAGRFINKMNGLLKIAAGYRGKMYKAHTLGRPTEENVYDYINNWVKQLPYDFRVLPGLKLGLSDYWHKAYHSARERAKGTNTDYQRNETFVDQYPNIEFVPHAQLEGQDFMYITTEDNIGPMINKPGEESLMTFEKSKREINGFADYKLGLYIKALGAQDQDGNPLGYDNQIFFSNDVEVLQDTYIPSESNDDTPSVKVHNALIVGGTNTTVTNITKIDDVAEGQYVHLLGDATDKASTVKSGANIILDGADFALTQGNRIVLRGLTDGKVIEVSRYVAGTVEEVAEVMLADGATTADAAQGVVFVTSANSEATALTDIENAVAGEKYTIKGGSDASPTSIANEGKFLLTANVSLTTGKYLTVEFNGTKFIEFSRG